MTQEQRNEIVAQASTMFVNEGVKAVRMDDIAHRLGVSKRTLYETFGDKDELIYLATSHHFTKIEKQHKIIATGAPNVLISIMRIMEEILESSEVNWKLMNAIKRFHPKVAARINKEDRVEKQALFLSALEIGVKDGLLNTESNLSLSITILQHLSHSLVMDSDDLPLPQGMTPQLAFFEIMLTVMRGISTPKGIAIIDDFVKNIERKY